MNIQAFISITVAEFVVVGSTDPIRVDESAGSVSFTVQDVTAQRDRSFTVQVCTTNGTAGG